MTPRPAEAPPGDLPAPERWLAALLVRGAGAEHVLGDLAERWHDDRARGMDRRAARGRLRRRLAASVGAWWAPAAWRQRRAGARTRAIGTIHDDGRTGVRWGGDGMRGWMGDVVFAVRTLVRRPTLALGVVLTLGLGVGATTAIWSVVDTVLLRPLAYDEPGSLVAVGTTFPDREWADREAGLQHLAGTSYLNFVEFRDRARSFASLGAAEPTGMLMPDQGGGPELVTAARATAGFWETLRVSPSLGRLFVPDEYERTDDAAPVLLSWGAWQRRFGGDPSVLGRALGTVGNAAVVVGVLPAGFAPPEAHFGHAPEFWMPLQPDHPRYANRGTRSVVIVGRLASGATVDAARDEMATLAARLAEEFPDGNVYPDGRRFGAGVNGLLEETVGTTGRTLYVFLAAAGLLLLLSVLNATTLLLARALDRTRELGVRVALGAGSGRIVRLLLAESLVLSGAGGVLGAALGWLGVRAFLRYGPASVPRMDEVVLDGRVLAATLAVALVSGVVAGLLPAVKAGRRPGSGLQARAGTDAGARLRTGLVAVQLGLAVLLLSGAGLLFHSFLQLRAVDPGFQPEGLLSFQVGVKRPGAPDGEEPWQAWDRLLEEVAAEPGVDAVAGTSNIPFQSPYWAPWIRLPGDAADHRREGVAGYAITPGYLDVVGTPLLRGRDVSRQDGPGAAKVALVNEAFVREHLDAGADAVGRTLYMTVGLDDDEAEAVTIVGVVGDVVQARAEEGALPAVYVPYTQTDWPLVQPVVRTTRSAEAMIPALRRAVARFSRVVPPQALGTLEARIAGSRTSPRFHALLLGTFAGVALLLASAGLYASLAHAVGRRRRELGIRMALGARRRGVRRMVLRQAAVVAGAGIGLGLAAALGLNRVLRSFLFGVEPDDPWALAGAALLLAVVAFAAAYLPARRATSVDPAEVLRAE